jgi:trans-2,3-dihydro-3-hydroxyanthranilate isomerase
MVMPLHYLTLDVFTRQKFAGNQLAVVWGEILSDKDMQKIAAEFNYSETTFLQPPENPAHCAIVRIFTPTAELPFAGHPNIGTAVAVANYLAEQFSFNNQKIIFEERAGLVPIDLWYEGKRCIGARLQAPKKFSLGKTCDPKLIAQALNLPEVAVDIRNHLPITASCGSLFIFAEISEDRWVSTAQPNLPVLADHKIDKLHIYHRDGKNLHTRMFAPNEGTLEDAATGSANIALAGLLAHLSANNSGQFDFDISQGIEMGRPSQLYASAIKENGQVIQTLIGGYAVPVAQGKLV